MVSSLRTLFQFMVRSPLSLPPKSRLMECISTQSFPFSYCERNSSSLIPLFDKYSPTCLYDTDSSKLLIEKSKHRRHLNQILSQLLISGLQSSFVAKLIDASSNLGEFRFARQLFDGIPSPNVFLWNAIIRCYSANDCFVDAIQMYLRMQAAFVPPDRFTFSYLVKPLTRLRLLQVGRLVHAQLLRQWLDQDVFLQNGLVSFYSRCGEISIARIVFDALRDRTIVSWTSIISGYCQNRQPFEALWIFKRMRELNVEPDWITLVSVIKACSDVEDMGHGRSIHASVIKMGVESEPDLGVALTAMYAKCGLLDSARLLFSRMEVKDVILWNAMVSGYAKNGYADEAIHIFKKMIDQKLEVDSITIRSVISACAQVGSLELAKRMGDYTRKCGLNDDIFISTALIDMYSKCGDLSSARYVFDGMAEKDVYVWSAMIIAYGLHGFAKEAIRLFESMKLDGVLPNDVTFLAILTACKHSGLIQDGWKLYHSMNSFGIIPRHQHCACMVDLLGRAGRLEEAFKFIQNMSLEPGPTVWSALLSSCRIHRHVPLGEYAAGKLLLLKPLDSRVYVQLYNLYASSNMWHHVTRVRGFMRKKGLSKDLGYSAIEVDGELHAFRAGDRSHPRSNDIFKKLEEVQSRLMEAAFVPHVESVHDLDYEDTVANLFNHSEMIAIAYGLIRTPAGTTLRIMKNLRACVNCHSAAKLISKFDCREIIVRDANRFHYFQQGICSCGDYW